MDTGAKSDMSIELTIKNHFIGIFENGWITISARKVHQNALIFFHRATVVLNVFTKTSRHRDG